MQTVLRFLILLLCSSSLQPLLAQKSILDYYYLLPEEVFALDFEGIGYRLPAARSRTESREKALVRANEKAGFILTQNHRIAIYKDRAKGKDYILVAPLAPYGGLNILVLNENYWYDARWQIFPYYWFPNRDFCYELPEVGTTLPVFDCKNASAKPAFSFFWSNGSFSKSIAPTLKIGPSNLNSCYRGLVDAAVLPSIFQGELTENTMGIGSRVINDDEDGLSKGVEMTIWEENGERIVAMVRKDECPTEMCNDEFGFFRFNPEKRIFENISTRVFPEVTIRKSLMRPEFRAESDCFDCEGYTLTLMENRKIGIEYTENRDGNGKETYSRVFHLENGVLVP